MKPASNLSGYSCRNVQGAHAKSTETSDFPETDLFFIYLNGYKSKAYYNIGGKKSVDLKSFFHINSFSLVFYWLSSILPEYLTHGCY